MQVGQRGGESDTQGRKQPLADTPLRMDKFILQKVEGPDVEKCAGGESVGDGDKGSRISCALQRRKNGPRQHTQRSRQHEYCGRDPCPRPGWVAAQKDSQREPFGEFVRKNGEPR